MVVGGPEWGQEREQHQRFHNVFIVFIRKFSFVFIFFTVKYRLEIFDAPLVSQDSISNGFPLPPSLP